MTKYPWAINKIKLQRAIEKFNSESASTEKDARIKQLYISMGGKIAEIKVQTITNPDVIPKIIDDIQKGEVEVKSSFIDPEGNEDTSDISKDDVSSSETVPLDQMTFSSTDIKTTE